jgi:hypothetical protein
MKKAIQRKTKASTTNKKNTRPFTAKQKGYKEDVYNNEEQKTYEKSNISKSTRRNTAGPKS